MASGTVYINNVAFQYFTMKNKVVVTHLPEGKEEATTINVDIPYSKERGTNLRNKISAALVEYFQNNDFLNLKKKGSKKAAAKNKPASGTEGGDPPAPGTEGGDPPAPGTEGGDPPAPGTEDGDVE